MRKILPVLNLTHFTCPNLFTLIFEIIEHKANLFKFNTTDNTMCLTTITNVYGQVYLIYRIVEKDRCHPRLCRS